MVSLRNIDKLNAEEQEVAKFLEKFLEEEEEVEAKDDGLKSRYIGQHWSEPPFAQLKKSCKR